MDSTSSESRPLLQEESIKSTQNIESKPDKKWKILGFMIIMGLITYLGYILTTDGVSVFSTHTTRAEYDNGERVMREARSPKHWTKGDALETSQTITLQIRAKQQNNDKLMGMVEAVSVPGGERYMEYYTTDELKSIFSPKEESVESLIDWLSMYDITKESITRKGFYNHVLEFTTLVENANAMFQATYHEYTHKETGEKSTRFDNSFSVPSSVNSDISVVSPSLHVPPSRHEKTRVFHSKQKVVPRIGKKTSEVTAEITGFCESFSSKYVCPSRLKSYYWMDSDISSVNADNTQCVASFLSEYYNMDDVSMFWDDFDITATTLVNYPYFEPSGDGDEAELDVEYITSTGQGVTTYVWDTEDDSYFISMAEGMMAYFEETAEIYVVSMSYGGDEIENGEDYIVLSSSLFGQASLLGMSFFASSGDSGVTSDGDLVEGGFSATYPASSPYVTGVGGTTGGSAQDDVDDDTEEGGWYYSGGGFSVYLDQPSWQTSAVAYYLENVETLPSSEYYDSTKAAYPDISARGNYYIIVVDEELWSVSGTSCSSPLIAGMFASFNDERLSNGLEPLGLVSPKIYDLLESEDFGTYFNDPIHGYNEGPDETDDIGFYCTAGWDPITGSGTPKYSKIFDYFTTEDSIFDYSTTEDSDSEGEE